MDKQGWPFPNVICTTIKSQNPPSLLKKQPGDLVQIMFDVTNLNELTMLRIPGFKTLNIFVPFAIIATATGQHHLIPSFLRFICEPSQAQQLKAPLNFPDANSAGPSDNAEFSERATSVSSDDEIKISKPRPMKRCVQVVDSDEEIEISDPRPVKQCFQVVDLTSSNNIL
ncbi:hypothetical protein BT96DRAFT_1003129 [Gymnopus androsaceus JB14]|uniref:Uncharacterized protein n=1 Tax=Gymnopus androsaceus JB14 TaxID=1447944 RepID=A0A6A4GVU6_9AGAR|nr:hypothetical protein BT96DRAFT_1003129 [Gymnopus androsaceus JB14]